MSMDGCRAIPKRSRDDQANCGPDRQAEGGMMQLALSLPRPQLSATDVFKNLLAHACGGTAPILGVVKLRHNAGHEKNTFNATVVMFDGRKAIVRIIDHRTVWRPKAPVQLTWVRMSGGDIELKDGKWRRIEERFRR